MKISKNPDKEKVNQILSYFEKKDFNNLNSEIAKLIKKFPQSQTPWIFLGMFYNLLNKLEESKKALFTALKIDNKNPEANRLIADILRKQGKTEEAVSYAKNSLLNNPEFSPSLDTLGTCLAANKDFNQAEIAFKKAIKFSNKENLGIYYNNLGNLQRILGNYKESISSLKKAIKFNSEILQIHVHLSLAYAESNNQKDALQILNKIKKENINENDKANIFTAYAHIYRKLNNIDKSLEYYRKALKIDGSRKSSIYNNLGEIYSIKRDYKKSLDFINKAINTSKNNNNYISNYIMNMAYFQQEKREVKFDTIKNLSKKINYIDFDNSSNKKLKKSDKKLNVGFISGDFYEHPVSFFLIDFIKKFDDKNFKSFAYYNYGKIDGITRTLKNYFSEFKNIGNLSEISKINLIKKDQIDILIDLSGHTAKNCLSIMKSKPAPLQMTWLGFSETSGIDKIDFIICDDISIPKNEEKWFVEKPLRLNNSYYNFSNPGVKKHRIINKNKDSVIFGNFGNIRKINSDVINLWKKILIEIPSSELLLKSEFYRDITLRKEIINYFTDSGINENRLLFEFGSSRENYFSSYNNIDVILDTFPYPGGTTTCESLFMGTPVIAMEGNSFIERNSANILKNSNLNEFIVKNKTEYFKLAKNFKKFFRNKYINKEKIRNKFLKSSIMDSNQFSHDFKSKIRSVWQEFCDE